MVDDVSVFVEVLLVFRVVRSIFGFVVVVIMLNVFVGFGINVVLFELFCVEGFVFV